MVTVAADASGREAIEPWLAAANQTHPSLLDPRMEVATLYGVRNVPSGFWIDESGRIVRANDPIYAKRNEQYLDAVRDWVAHGAASRFVADQAALEKRRPASTFNDVEALAEARLGLHLISANNPDAAQRHFERARQLSPQNWMFRRQAWKFAGTGREALVAAIQAPDAPAFYPDLDLPD